jgi:hypothetical protein
MHKNPGPIGHAALRRVWHAPRPGRRASGRQHRAQVGHCPVMNDGIATLGQAPTSLDAVEHPLGPDGVRLGLALRRQQPLRLRSAQLLRRQDMRRA